MALGPRREKRQTVLFRRIVTMDRVCGDANHQLCVLCMPRTKTGTADWRFRQSVGGTSDGSPEHPESCLRLLQAAPCLHIRLLHIIRGTDCTQRAHARGEFLREVGDGTIREKRHSSTHGCMIRPLSGQCTRERIAQYAGRLCVQAEDSQLSTSGHPSSSRDPGPPLPSATIGPYAFEPKSMPQAFFPIPTSASISTPTTDTLSISSTWLAVGPLATLPSISLMTGKRDQDRFMMDRSLEGGSTQGMLVCACVVLPLSPVCVPSV